RLQQVAHLEEEASPPLAKRRTFHRLRSNSGARRLLAPLPSGVAGGDDPGEALRVLQRLHRQPVAGVQMRDDIVHRPLLEGGRSTPVYFTQFSEERVKLLAFRPQIRRQLLHRSLPPMPASSYTKRQSARGNESVGRGRV